MEWRTYPNMLREKEIDGMFIVIGYCLRQITTLPRASAEFLPFFVCSVTRTAGGE